MPTPTEPVTAAAGGIHAETVITSPVPPFPSITAVVAVGLGAYTITAFRSVTKKIECADGERWMVDKERMGPESASASRAKGIVGAVR